MKCIKEGQKWKEIVKGRIGKKVGGGQKEKIEGE